MRVAREFGRRFGDQNILDAALVFGARETDSVGDPKNVRVDGDCRLAESRVQNDIRGFAPDAGQRLQFGAGFRHSPAMAACKDLRQSDHIARLVAKQADGFDALGQPRLAEFDHLARRFDFGENVAHRGVHRFVGRLRRQNDGDQQLIAVAVAKFGRRARIAPRAKFQKSAAEIADSPAKENDRVRFYNSHQVPPISSFAPKNMLLSADNVRIAELSPTCKVSAVVPDSMPVCVPDETS